MIPISLSSPHGAAKRICFTDLFLLSLIFHARQQFSLSLIISYRKYNKTVFSFYIFIFYPHSFILSSQSHVIFPKTTTELIHMNTNNTIDTNKNTSKKVLSIYLSTMLLYSSLLLIGTHSRPVILWVVAIWSFSGSCSVIVIM